MNILAIEDKDRMRRQFKPDLAEQTKLEPLWVWIDAGMKRVSGKLSGSGCFAGHRSPG